MSKVKTLWEEVHGSLWFLPGLLTVVGAALALFALELDRRFLPGRHPAAAWLFQGGAEGARGVLTAISSGMITVTGVLFSVTIVALQLASSQFTPRVLRTFTADRGNQAVLGVFIATFTYTLLVGRAVRSERADAEAFVPSLSVTMAIGLTLVSIGFFIYFVDHLARSIRVSVILERVTRETVEHIRDHFPERRRNPGAAEPRRPAAKGQVPGRAVHARESGYLQAVDEDALFDLARERRWLIRTEPVVGDFVLPDAVLARVWPPGDCDEKGCDAVRKAFLVGAEPTVFSDVQAGITVIMDIAVKALSPSINDPTTATLCLDRVAEILIALGRREWPPDARTDADGTVRLVTRRPGYAAAVRCALDPIRHFGVSIPMIAAKLFETLRRVAAVVPPDRQGVLAEQATLILRAMPRALRDDADRARIERVGESVLAQITGAARDLGRGRGRAA